MRVRLVSIRPPTARLLDRRTERLGCRAGRAGAAPRIETQRERRNGRVYLDVGTAGR